MRSKRAVPTILFAALLVPLFMLATPYAAMIISEPPLLFLAPVSHRHLHRSTEIPYHTQEVLAPANLLMPPTQHWVAANPLKGRLGNQLFIAASSHGIAKLRGALWCLEHLSVLDQALLWTERPKPCPLDVGYFQPLTEMGRHARFSRLLIESSQGSNVTVGVYLQSFRYFHDNGSLPFTLRTAEWGKQWAARHGINAGIHVRRGDFLTDQYHTDLLPPTEYYAAAIKHLKSLTSEKLVFFVSTDDLPWVRSQPMFENMIITEDGRKPEEDMSILAACKHMILSAGTFSWWSAYLSEHRSNQSFKIYYSEPTQEWENGRRVPADHYPHWWVGINRAQVQSIMSQ